MSTLKKLEEAGLLGELDALLAKMVTNDDHRGKIRTAIDEKGFKGPAVVVAIGQATQASAVQQGLFKELMGLDKKLAAAAGPSEAAAAPAGEKPARKPRAPRDPNAPAAPPAPRKLAVDMLSQRGPGSPFLKKYGVPETAWPAPIEVWWPRLTSAVRKLHEFLVANEVTLEELIAAGAANGWTEQSARKHWTYFQSQHMVNAGWILKVDPNTKKGKMVVVEATWDFNQNKALLEGVHIDTTPAPAAAPSAPAEAPQAPAAS